MTLFETAPWEEVKTTTSLVEQALTLSPDPSIRREVRRFGFEYEMLPSGHQDSLEDSELAEAVDEHMDQWRTDRDDNQDETGSYCCDDCENTAYAEERASYLRRFGRGQTPVGGPRDLINRAHANNLINDPQRHSYHCDCGDCDYTRDAPLMTAQNDCTVGVEFVSRIIDLDNFDQAARDIDSWVQMMQHWAEDGHWMPDGRATCGNHVHVSADGDLAGRWEDSELRQRAFHNINAIYAAFDWIDIADGGCGSIRGYNQKPQRDHDYGGSWLSDRGYGTFEHRLWNTPRDPQRLWAHLGISIGLQRWGFNIAQNMPEASLWTTTADRYGYTRQRMNDEMYNALTTNVGEIVRGIRAYIPQHDQFDIARDLIVNLTPTR